MSFLLINIKLSPYLLQPPEIEKKLKLLLWISPFSHFATLGMESNSYTLIFEELWFREWTVTALLVVVLGSLALAYKWESWLKNPNIIKLLSFLFENIPLTKRVFGKKKRRIGLHRYNKGTLRKNRATILWFLI